LLHGLDELPEVAGTVSWRNVGLDLGVEGEYADGVPLFFQESGQGCGQGVCVVFLDDAGLAEQHGFAPIQANHAAQIGFILILFDVITIASRQQLPVQVAQVIAG